MKEIINAFWAGFEDPATGAPTLDQTPSFVDTITLAFTGPGDNNSFTTEYLCEHYSSAQIQKWVQALQKRGQKVLISVYDNEGHHWADINIPRFVQNALDVIRGEWGADGVDIDSESGNASPQNMIELTSKFRAGLGAKGSPGSILTYDTFAFSEWDQEVLQSVGSDFDWINLMAYFRLYDPMVRLFNDYANLVGADNLTIGVKPGKGGFDQATPLDEVIQLASYSPPVGSKRGMMLYNLSIDTPHFTGKPTFTWANAIAKNLPNSTRTSR